MFQIEVTDTLVSAHISCPDVVVLTKGEPAGHASIEIDFTASS